MVYRRKINGLSIISIYCQSLDHPYSSSHWSPLHPRCGPVSFSKGSLSGSNEMGSAVTRQDHLPPSRGRRRTDPDRRSTRGRPGHQQNPPHRIGFVGHQTDGRPNTFVAIGRRQTRIEVSLPYERETLGRKEARAPSVLWLGSLREASPRRQAATLPEFMFFLLHVRERFHSQGLTRSRRLPPPESGEIDV